MVRNVISFFILGTLAQIAYAEKWWIAGGQTFTCEIAKFNPDFYLNSGVCKIAFQNEEKGIIAISCEGDINTNLVYARTFSVCKEVVESIKSITIKREGRH